jgi:putative hemolysin
VSTIVSFLPIRIITRGLIGLSNVILPGKGLKEGPFVSEEELLALADVAVEEDVIEREERQLIHSIIEFGDTVVREVMVPRPDMVTVEARASVSDVMEVAISAGFSRIPVYEQGIDDIVGIVYAKDLMRAVREGRADGPVRELARSARFVPETKRVAELMPEMQREKAHMAIVVDEYGGTAGLVTLEDLIEELVGEIVDEYDVEELPAEPLPDGGVRVNARMPIDEVNDLLGAAFPEGDFDTVGGLMFNLLGHVPTEGESVDVNGHRLHAEKVQGRRIGRVRISKLPTGQSGDEAPEE